MRVRLAKRIPARKGKPEQIKFNVSMVGTGWCFVANKYVATAQHIFDSGKPRNANDKFFVFTTPDNGAMAFHTPVVGFPHEDDQTDMAVLEIAPVAPFDLKGVPVCVSGQKDGQHVLTCGFPSPVIGKASIDESGNWMGGELLLKSHVNEGIISAQYSWGSHHAYELNVGWHHGESGGPVFSCEPLAVFAMMQFYRNIESPHGTVAGPHMGRAVVAMETLLRDLGATIA